MMCARNPSAWFPMQSSAARPSVRLGKRIASLSGNIGSLAATNQTQTRDT
jgi:hypothetical protein